MKKYISILFIFLYSFALAQDVYPNFSSPKKQFKFEKERIYIDEVEEKEQIVEGGGSEFNVWALYNNVLPDYLQQPTLRQGNISTRYVYRYNFEITQNNKELNEVDLLYAVGLKDEADDIIKSHERELKNFNKKYTKKQRKKKSYKPVYVAGLVSLSGLSIAMLNNLLNKEWVYNYESQRSEYVDGATLEPIFWASFSLFATSFVSTIYKWNYINSYNSKAILTPSAPVLQQTMSSKQLTAVAESYNRQVYKQIQSQP